MRVAMVGVGEVRVAVLHRRVAMRMGVLLALRQTQIRVVVVIMLMMFVVGVLVFMLHRLMSM